MWIKNGQKRMGSVPASWVTGEMCAYDFSDEMARCRLPLLGLVTGQPDRILMTLPAMWSVLLCLHLSPAEDSAAMRTAMR